MLTSTATAATLTPVAKTEALQGAKSAKSAALTGEQIQSKLSAIFNASNTAAERADAIIGAQGPKQMQSLCDLFAQSSDEAITQALTFKRTKGAKTTTRENFLSECKVILRSYKAGLLHKPAVLDAIAYTTLESGAKRANGWKRCVINAREQLERADANLSTAQRMGELLAVQQEMAGQPQHETPTPEMVEAAMVALKAEQAKAIAEALETEQANETPQAQGKRAAKALIRKFTNDDDILDTVSLNSYVAAMSDAIKEAITNK